MADIDDVFQLRRAGGVSEPKLDLASIFNDGIRGLINSWQDYPYFQDEQSNRHDVGPTPLPYNEITEEQTPVAPNNSDSGSGPELYWKTSPNQAAATAK
ncbi:hypothetical protein SLS58_007141 [Diplodia intermedia]|uniref:Uncharacterized protein n=1 Tax=Diplodia intermedia TaxID=856260 RepID=A0ABR3TL53_9PEZI